MGKVYEYIEENLDFFASNENLMREVSKYHGHQRGIEKLLQQKKSYY